MDDIQWERRDAIIQGAHGAPVFELRGVEVPQSWSQLATNVVASKYFRGNPGEPGQETSVRQLIGRVTTTLRAWARAGDYFATPADLDTFVAELTYLLLHQMAAFNSPVWFNLGVDKAPQCSACFINGIEDSIESIYNLAKIEGRLFKYGSGTGTNLSVLRGSKEPLSGGGTASGPVSFMRGYDAFAGVVKSGGKTRRAAKMVMLDVDHPDIVEFVQCKANEEKKAWALIAAGYDSAIDGEAYRSIFFQNSNNSVRVPDAYMQAVESDATWQTINRVDGKPAASYAARGLLRQMAEAAHLCGDPGLQFHSTINRWHTCAADGAIVASNPCSEYMFLNDTACNLASLNLLRFRDANGDVDTAALRHAVDIVFTAQEIIVDGAGYPTDDIARNSRAYRPLGLGYANLGALLMARGLPYDSDTGRAWAACITAIMSGEAYAQSARIAAAKGAFAAFDTNREAMLRVMSLHHEAAHALPSNVAPSPLVVAAHAVWDEALALGRAHGYRNAQATVLAPTGTIAFMMDCDTTGIEPDLALIKHKKLVGGGVLKMINATVPEALRRLGYDEPARIAILKHLERTETIEGAPTLSAQHVPVFDCALQPRHGHRFISADGHLRMMAAVQPFLSGAISKTVNLPESATVDDIVAIYTQAWRLGLKAIAVYRDGCKRAQPLNSGEARALPVIKTVIGNATPTRHRLPDERPAITHKFSVAGHEGYITAGMYPNGTVGEVFITMSKEGSTISGLMDALATAVSLALQYGVPLTVLVDKLSHTRYEPSGFTGNRDIPLAKSITDYLFRWLGLRFLSGASPAGGPVTRPRESADAPACAVCGAIMIRETSCYRCDNCGATSGCS